MPSPVSDRRAADPGIPRDLRHALAEFTAKHCRDDVESVAILSRAGGLQYAARGTATSFAVPAMAWVDLIEDAAAVIHNHPSGQAWPSLLDQAQQIATAVPWAIVPRNGEAFWFGDGVEPALFGRPFRWGATDCYGFVRDALRTLFGLELRNYPRAWQFERTGERLFEAHIAQEGFEVIAGGVAAAIPGDVILLATSADQPSTHCLVVLEDGKAWHHGAPAHPFSPTRRPRSLPLERLQAFAHRVCRHA